MLFYIIDFIDSNETRPGFWNTIENLEIHCGGNRFLNAFDSSKVTEWYGPNNPFTIAEIEYDSANGVDVIIQSSTGQYLEFVHFSEINYMLVIAEQNQTELLQIFGLEERTN